MLSILVLSQEGEGYGIVNRLVNEGHIVKFWIADAQAREALNVREKIDRLDEPLQTADLVLDASSRFGGICEDLRAGGKVVLGGRVQELLTYNSDYAVEVAQNLLDLATYGSNEEGIRLQFAGWFNGHSWVDNFTSQVSHRLIDGEKGPFIGYMGSVIWREQKILPELNDLLSKVKTTGFISVEVKMLADRVEYIGFDCSLTGALATASFELIEGNLGDYLYKIASGKYPRKRKEANYSIAVKILRACELSGVQVNPHAEKHFWPELNPTSFGYVTACGDGVRETRRRAYRTITNIANIDTVYRSDIGLEGVCP